MSYHVARIPSGQYGVFVDATGYMMDAYRRKPDARKKKWRLEKRARARERRTR